MSYVCRSLRITLGCLDDPDYSVLLLKCRDMENKYFIRYVRSFEIGSETGKAHYHYYIQIKSEVALRQFIRKEIGSNRNGVYSMTKCDEEYPLKYLSYICKEDKDSVWFNMSDEVKKATMEWKNEFDYDRKVKRKEGKIVKIRKYLVDGYLGIPTSPSTLVNAIMQYHIDNNCIISPFQIQNYCITLLSENDKNYRKQLEEKMVFKIENF